MTKPILIWSAVVALLVGMALAGGCAIDEMVTVDVPPNTREHFRDNLEANVPPSLSLRDARILRAEGDRKFKQRLEMQAADHAASNDALDREIADGAFIEGLIGSSINTGIDLAIPGLATVPGGAILTTLLAGVGMWLVPRPGESKARKKAEDQGYDLGRNETLDSLAKAP